MAKLQPDDYSVLGKLSQLRSLSLSRANVNDTVVSGLPLGLTRLWLNGTSVTDKSVSRLAAMNGLVSLDIADTGITSDGLRLLEPLRSLQMLWIDDSCISAESVETLRHMQLQVVEVAVLEGMGRKTHELLSACDGPQIRGHHRDGYLLWEADSAWSDTLAGVVEAVVSEIGLDSRQAAQLLEALGDQGPTMKSSAPSTPPAVSWFGEGNSPDQGIGIESVDEFIREIQKVFHDIWAVRRFGREIHCSRCAEAACCYSHGGILAVQVPFLLRAVR